jgi:tRNA(fMet)-specific endonuclease VapC
MPRRFLLDTNVLSRAIREPRLLVRKISRIGAEGICTSIIVACELRFGARKKGSDVLSRRVDELLKTLVVLPLDGNVDEVYAQIRDVLETRGQPIGGNDYLIAAHALAEDCVLVTENVSEFRRVPRLRVENWLPAVK